MKARQLELARTYFPILLRGLSMPFGRSFPLLEEDTRRRLPKLLPQFAEMMAGEDGSPALVSPSYRRRLRRKMWQQWRPKLKAGSLLFKQALKSFEPSLHAYYPQELPEYTIDQILGLTIEAWVKQLHADPGAMETEFPSTKILPPRFRKEILREVGEQGYRDEVVATLWEMLSNRVASAYKVTKGARESSFWEMLGMDAPLVLSEDISTVSSKQIVNLANEIWCDLFDQATQRRLLYWCLRRLLIHRIAGDSLYSRKHEVSLETPIGEGITLGDTLPDPKAGSQIRHTESRIDVEILLKDLPAAQKRSIEIYLEHMQTGTPVKDICEREWEDYEAIRQAFHRVKKKQRL